MYPVTIPSIVLSQYPVTNPSIIGTVNIYSPHFSRSLTDHLKAGEKALEEVLTGVGEGQRPELGHHDAVLLAVLPVGVALQEATAVGHLSLLDLELMQ